MHIYSVTVKAKNYLTISTTPSAVKAEKETYAREKAMAGAYRTYPKSEGWTDHTVEMVQIPDEWIVEVYNLQ